MKDFPQICQVNAQEFIQQKSYKTQVYILFGQVFQLCLMMHIKSDEHQKLIEAQNFIDLQQPLE